METVRGRPVSIDPLSVITVAASLFQSHGFSSTTMDDVAKAAGISRKSLFLYFPSKTDLVWHRSGPIVKNLELDIGRLPDPLEVVVSAVLSGFEKVHRSDETLRAQVLLHLRDPDVRDLVESRGQLWRDVIRNRLMVDQVEPVVAEMIEYGFWKSMWAALERWALDGGDLDQILKAQISPMMPISRKQIAISTT
jgi:AcrR family transcriptional regulator